MHLGAFPITATLSFGFSGFMSFCSCLLLTLALAAACITWPTPAMPAESNTDTRPCEDNTGHYSVLRLSGRECTATPAADPKPPGTPMTYRDELLDAEWLQSEILGFTIIGVAQIRGGAPLLGDIWYAAAVLTPPLLKQHPRHGMKLNFFAITPPFVALGMLNGYLHRDHAGNARIFLSNFIGFNLSLAWAHAAWKSPPHSSALAEHPYVPSLDTSVFALRDGAGLYVAYRW